MKIAKVTVVSGNYSSYYSIGCYTAGGGLVSDIERGESNIIVRGFSQSTLEKLKSEKDISENSLSELTQMCVERKIPIDILSLIDQRVPITIDYY